MKLKDGFMLKKISDDYMLVPVGTRSIEFKAVMHLNDTGAFLYEKLENGTDETGLVEALLSEYDVDRETAQKDVQNFIKNLIDAGVAE